MSPPKPGRPERNAGAFLGPDVLVPAPMRTLSDDYHDEPADPEDSDRAPEPEPPGMLPGMLQRLLGRLSRRERSAPDGGKQPEA